MEDKKAYLVQLDYEETDDIQLLICSGLKELATGCKAAVKEFSECMGREHVDHLVDIHLTSISGWCLNLLDAHSIYGVLNFTINESLILVEMLDSRKIIIDRQKKTLLLIISGYKFL